MPVLKVKVNGEWVNVAGGGNIDSGAESNVIIVQIDETNNTANMSSSEIEAAINEKKIVFAITSLNNDIYHYNDQIIIINSSSGTTSTQSSFVLIKATETSITSNYVYIDELKNVTYEIIDVTGVGEEKTQVQIITWEADD